MRFCEKRQPPLTKNFSKGVKSMKIYKYITILMILLLGIFCGRNLGQSLAPDTFLYPAACFGLALIVWDQTMRPHFEMIDDLSFWNDIQIYFRLIKGETVVSKWWLLSLWNDGWFSLRNKDMTVLSICDKGFFSLCLRSKRQSFFLSYEKDRFSANERYFRKDSFSLQTIETLSFQKDRLPSKEKVLILI